MCSQVQSSPFRVTFLLLSSFGGYQILDETSYGSAGASSKIIYILIGVLGSAFWVNL